MAMTEREALKLALEALRQIDEAMPFPVAKLAQAAIKEALAQPEQEPVALQRDVIVVNLVREGINKHRARELAEHFSKHTTPPQRKPLTDEEIILIVAECASSHQHTDIHFARAIEAAHGIKRLV